MNACILKALDRIDILIGDITLEKTDAIVNAANETLLGGGGVDGAIHRAAGPGLLAECRLLGGCRTGEAKYTKAYNLPSIWVIHTVGPVWRGGRRGEGDLLRKAYRSSLECAASIGARTVSFPAISTGVYSFPAKEAALIAVTETVSFLAGGSSVDKVRFVCFSRDSEAAHLEAVGRVKAGSEFQ